MDFWDKISYDEIDKMLKGENADVSVDNQMRLPNGKIITFNTEQFEGLQKIKHWLKNGHTFFTLAGYAGTGKTTMIKKILEKYYGGVVVSAPTHKAKKVVMNTTGKEGQTLHALLGLRPDVDLDNFNPNDPKFNPIAVPRITDYNFVIIDEASMINQELYDLILEKTKGSRTKVLFMGDPAQIPPVGEKESVVFKQTEIELHQLTKIERQNDTNPLAFIYDALRNNLNRIDGGFERKSNMNDLGEGVTFTLDKKAFRLAILEKFTSEEYKKDTDFAKVIAWKNETVMMANKVIRDELFGTKTDIVEVGDILMAYRSISDAKQRYNIIENSADYRVMEKSELVENAYGIKGYNVKLREDLANRHYRFQDVFIIDANDHNNLHLYGDMHDFFRDMGKANKKMWTKYYDFRRANILMKTIDKYKNGQYRSTSDVIVKDLDYGYAITGHKCLSENSNVLTNKGNIKLKDIKVGDYVSVGVGSGTYKIVIDKFDSGIKKSFEITTKSGYKIRCSKDHRILDSHHKFKPLSEFNIGDYVPINRSEFRKHLSHSKDINYFLGLLVADGSYSGNRKHDPYRIDLTIGLDDEENIEFIKNFYLENNIKYGITKKNNSNSIQYYNSGKVWRIKLFELGLNYVKGEEKSTPTSILNGTYQMKSNFIAGLFDGDGHISKQGRIILVNNSKKLLLEVQGMLLEFGIISIIRKEKESFRLIIVGTSVSIFKKHISFRLKRKQDVLDKYHPTIKTNIDFIPHKDEIFKMVKSDLSQNGFFVKNKGLNPVDFRRFPNHIKHLSYENLNNIIKLYEFNGKPINKRLLEIIKNYYFYDEITSIECVGEEQMYDLEIKDIHQYVADGFIVHNSQGSTYSHVFVMENDINENWVLKERNQIKYVALTRPSLTATVLTTKLD